MEQRKPYNMPFCTMHCGSCKAWSDGCLWDNGVPRLTATIRDGSLAFQRLTPLRAGTNTAGLEAWPARTAFLEALSCMATVV
jgi:hypothetical protein